MTRVEEVMEFARRLGIKKLGVATCAGLLSESAVLAKILRSNAVSYTRLDVYKRQVHKVD